MNEEQLQAYRYWLVARLANKRQRLAELDHLSNATVIAQLQGAEIAYANAIDELDERIRQAS